MLNQRQIEIVLEIYEGQGAYFTASSLAKKKNTSLRTIQGDIKNIKDELTKGNFATIESKKSKGSYLNIINQDAFSDWMNGLYMQYTCADLDYPLNRASKIINVLLGNFRAVSMYDLETELYVSHSTLLGDLKLVQENIEPFNLRLVRENSRLKIAGFEVNKRRCLAQNPLYLAHVQGAEASDDYIDFRRIAFIKDMLIDIFTKNQYYISDIDFNNAVLTINIMLHRIRQQFFIKENELEITDDLEKELSISQDIFKKLKARFLVKIPKEEVEFFAIYLKGQEIFQNNDIISRDVDEFITEAFNGIKKLYNVDFNSYVGLKIAMGLHCIPLLIRLKYDMQIKDDILGSIKENFPLGYDIASYFAHLLTEKFGGKANECEVSLIAAHFYGSILEMRQKKQDIKILVISSMKQSMTILMRALLRKWFAAEFTQLDFMHERQITEDMLDAYDVFLTTEKNSFYEKGLAMLVSNFLTENDRRNIKLLLDGFKSVEDVLNIFQKDLYFDVTGLSKEEILAKLTYKAAEKYGMEGLHEAVLRRENMRSTYFSQSVAIPHPIIAITADTFIAVGISQTPVAWDDEGHSVNIIIMLHIGKNNLGSFQLWDYMSQMLMEKSWVKKALQAQSFVEFCASVADVLKKRF